MNRYLKAATFLFVFGVILVGVFYLEKPRIEMWFSKQKRERNSNVLSSVVDHSSVTEFRDNPNLTDQIEELKRKHTANGLSLKSAVLIQAKSSSEQIDEVRDWLVENLQGFDADQKIEPEVIKQDGCVFWTIRARVAAGGVRVFYFEIVPTI